MKCFEFRCKTAEGKLEIRTEYLPDEEAARQRARELMFQEPFILVKIRAPWRSFDESAPSLS